MSDEQEQRPIFRLSEIISIEGDEVVVKVDKGTRFRRKNEKKGVKILTCDCDVICGSDCPDDCNYCFCNMDCPDDDGM